MFNHAPEKYPCPFCLLIQGVENDDTLCVQSDIIARNPHAIAFVSSHHPPSNPGNILIAPQEHFENLYDLPDHFAQSIHQLARSIALSMKTALGCEGVSTRQHNEPAGNQDVWHFHVHVTPRYTDDGLYGSTRVFMPPRQRREIAELLKAHWPAEASRELPGNEN